MLRSYGNVAQDNPTSQLAPLTAGRGAGHTEGNSLLSPRGGVRGAAAAGAAAAAAAAAGQEGGGSKEAHTPHDSSRNVMSPRWGGGEGGGGVAVNEVARQLRDQSALEHQRQLTPRKVVVRVGVGVCCIEVCVV